MTTALEAFRAWLLDKFEEEYDPENWDHLLKLSLFEAGWDAREEAQGD